MPTTKPSFKGVAMPIVATRLDITIGRYEEEDGTVFSYPYVVLYDFQTEKVVGKVQLGQKKTGKISIKLAKDGMSPDLSKCVLVGLLKSRDWPAVRKSLHDTSVPEPGSARDGNGRAQN